MYDGRQNCVNRFRARFLVRSDSAPPTRAAEQRLASGAWLPERCDLQAIGRIEMLDNDVSTVLARKWDGPTVLLTSTL